MKRIEFQCLHATDFKVYTSFTFDFGTFAPGCHSIRGRNNVTPRLGSNGVGKSTLWDALTFALYGKTTKRLRAQDVQPYGTQACPVVRLDLKVDGDPHQIVRRALPHALSLDGASCGQERVDQLLGLDLDLFLHTVVLAQGLPLFLDLEPRFKLQLLSDVLHLNRFETYSRLAQGTVDDLRRQEQKLAMQHESVTGAIAEVGREMAVVRRQSEAFQVAKKDEVADLQDSLKKAQKCFQLTHFEVEKALTAYEKVSAEMHKARDALTRAEVKRSGAVKLQMQLRSMKVGSACPHCGQPVTEEACQHLEASAKRMLGESRYDQLLSEHGKLARMMTEARSYYDRYVITEREVERHVTAAELALSAARKKDNPFTDQMHALQGRLSELHRSERSLTQKLAEVEAKSATVTPWVSGFRDIRLIVLDNTLAALSVLTTSYANELGLPCEVKFSIDRQTKSGTTVNGIHMAVDTVEKFEAWSGGEAQRLRLAASLALSASLLAEAGLNVNLLALDEPSAHLSPEGLNELTSFLDLHAEAEARTIFLTDQRPLRVQSSVLLERNADNVVLHQ